MAAVIFQNQLKEKKRKAKELAQQLKKQAGEDDEFHIIAEEIPLENLLCAVMKSAEEEAEGKFKTPKCMCQPTEVWRERWDFFIMLIATWNSFTLPIEIAFQPPQMTQSLLYKVQGYLIDLCFAIDIFVVFRTTISNEDGTSIVTDQKAIARSYLRGDFAIDLLATVPLDSIAQIFDTNGKLSQYFKLFGILKLVRLLRLSRIITKLSVRRDTKVILKLLKMTFFLIMYVHCQGCVWYYIVNRDGIWMPPLDTVWGWQKHIFFNETLMYRYWMSVYTSLLFLLCNDLQPRGTFQVGFAAGADLAGAFFIAYIFGELTVLVSDLNESQLMFQKDIDKANTAMKTLDLDRDLQTKVIAYLNVTAESKEAQKEMMNFLSDIPSSRKSQVTQILFQDLIKSGGLFNQSLSTVTPGTKLAQEKEMRFIGSLLQPVEQAPEEIVISQGSYTYGLFFSIKGVLRVEIEDFTGNIHEAPKFIYANSLFGEISYLLNCKRTATVTAMSYVSLLQLSGKIKGFEFPIMKEYLAARISDYQDAGLHSTMSIIRKGVDYFSALDSDSLQKMCYFLKSNRFDPETKIVFENQPLKSIIFIRTGLIDVKVNSSMFEQYLLQRLTPGCSYGAQAFLVPAVQRAKHSMFILETVTCGEYLSLDYRYIDMFWPDEARQNLQKYQNYYQSIDPTTGEQMKLPICDFRIYRPFKKNMIQCFQQAVRRAVIMNKRSRSLKDMWRQIGQNKNLKDDLEKYDKYHQSVGERMLEQNLFQKFNETKFLDRLEKLLQKSHSLGDRINNQYTGFLGNVQSKINETNNMQNNLEQLRENMRTQN